MMHEMKKNKKKIVKMKKKEMEVNQLDVKENLLFTLNLHVIMASRARARTKTKSMCGTQINLEMKDTDIPVNGQCMRRS